MTNEASEVDLTWGLQKIRIPDRSHFYPLSPLAIGTPYAESLISYVTRLSNAHLVKPRDFVAHGIAPFLKRPGVLSHGSTYFSSFGKQHGIQLNGSRMLAQDWVETLERLTSRNDLKYLTLIPWSKIFYWKRLLWPSKAWCARCFGDWRATGQPLYEPLLWSVLSVLVCPIHIWPLSVHCPHCGGLQPPLAPNSLPGFCYRCQGWLGASRKWDPENDKCPFTEKLKIEIWLAGAAGELIAAAPSIRGRLRKERIKHAREVYLDHISERGQAAFKDWPPLAEVRRGQRRRKTVDIELFSRLCYALGTTPLKLLTDETLEIDSDHIALLPPSHLPIQRKSFRRKVNRPELERQLKAAIQSTEPALPLTKVAKKLLRHHVCLKKWFPDLCAQISKKYREYLRQRKAERTQKLCNEVYEITCRLADEGIYPSARRVESLLETRSDFRSPAARFAWQEALRKLGVRK